MRQTCANHWCKAPFEVTQDESAFLERMAFRFGNAVIPLPAPVRCPACRLQVRTCHRNERFLYRRKCDLSGNDIVSIYHAEPPSGEPYTVYAQEEWHGDRWDPMEYGLTFDFAQPFFAQWKKLHKAVPRMSLITVSNENSDFTTGTGYCRNCYLINSSEHCEDCYYGKLLQTCRNCVDCSYLYDSELCHECVNAYNCYGCTHVLFSKNCKNCHFSSALNACSDCCLCTNLEHKQYCFENEQLTKEEYGRKTAALSEGSWKQAEEWQRRLEAIERGRIHRAATLVNCEGCTGDYIENSKNCAECYDLTDSEDCRFVHVGVKVKDNLHCSNMYLDVELCYDLLGAIEVFHGAYSLFCFYSQNILYCEYCLNCKDCFGCNGLRRKQYCILNRQYTKEEYEALVPKIIAHMEKNGEWGLFFPAESAPFSYAESLASEYFPLRESEAAARGFCWKDRPDSLPDITKIIPASQLPDRIADIPDDVQNWAITCQKTKRPFKITKQELLFYRRMSLPLPRLHPDLRYDRRLAVRNPRALYGRQCGSCGKAVQTTFAPERPETVYCEQCYLKEVY